MIDTNALTNPPRLMIVANAFNARQVRLEEVQPAKTIVTIEIVDLRRLLNDNGITTNHPSAENDHTYTFLFLHFICVVVQCLRQERKQTKK